MNEAPEPNRIEPLLETRKFRVQRWYYGDPQRGPYTREAVLHDGAVAVIPLLDQDRIVMIHNIRHVVRRELLEIPAGTLEPGEDPRDTARRELEEETGYRCDSLDPLGSFYTTPGISNELMHLFVAQGLTPGQQNLEATEQIRVEIFPIDQLMHMLTTGQIQDGKTIAALSLYYLHRSLSQHSSFRSQK